MQAFPAWAPPVGTLGRILAETRERVAALQACEAELLEAAPPAAPSLAAALDGRTVAVIAEVKRSSPSRGSINPSIDPVAQAAAYHRGGARGVSVLTEPRHFGGSPDDLRSIRGAVPIPALKKDFHIHPLQLLEARALGASAVLLIARAVPPEELRSLARDSRALGLETLVEVRDEAELEVALSTGAAMIGVNNRDLETLAIDMSTADRLIPLVPRDRVAIAESGVASAADVARAAAAGADAVLVGSCVSAAPDPAAAVRALAGVARGGR